MADFSKSLDKAEELLGKMAMVNKGKSLGEAGIDAEWIKIYGIVARRCKDDRELGLSGYPYERGPTVGPTTGGFFEHQAWPIRTELEKQKSMHPIATYEAHYINAIGYWASIDESCANLRNEALKDNKNVDAEKLDVWCNIFNRYVLRATGLRTEFYKMAAKDPVYARLVLPNLQRKDDVPAADDLKQPLEEQNKHMASQMIKAVATLAASNATKRAGSGNKSGPANDQ